MLLIFLWSRTDRICSDRLYFCFWSILSFSLEMENLNGCRFLLMIPSMVARSGSLAMTVLFLEVSNFLWSGFDRLLAFLSGWCLWELWGRRRWLYFSE